MDINAEQGSRRTAKLLEAGLYLAATGVVWWQGWRLIFGPSLIIDLQPVSGMRTFLDVLKAIAGGDEGAFFAFIIYAAVLAGLVNVSLWLTYRASCALDCLDSKKRNTAL